jgi:ERCC4-type nuclease
MKIIIDEKENALYEKCINCQNTNITNSGLSVNVTNSSCIIEKTVLHIGDIYVLTNEDQHICVIERKTFPDLLASIKDGRYEEQSHRLLHSTQLHSHNIIYILEGIMGQIKTTKEKQLIYSAITSLQLFKGFTVIRTSSTQETAEFLLGYCKKVEKNLSKNIVPKYMSSIKGHPNDNITFENVNGQTNTNNILTEIKKKEDVSLLTVKKSKKENITPETIGTLILSQIPYINSISANTIMKKYNYSFIEFIKDLEANPNCLNDIYIQSKDGKHRKLASNVIKNIHLFLLWKSSTILGGTTDG